MALIDNIIALFVFVLVLKCSCYQLNVLFSKGVIFFLAVKCGESF